MMSENDKTLDFTQKIIWAIKDIGLKGITNVEFSSGKPTGIVRECKVTIFLYPNNHMTFAIYSPSLDTKWKIIDCNSGEIKAEKEDLFGTLELFLMKVRNKLQIDFQNNIEILGGKGG